ncbi:sugar ABC transporter substrate-binding protein [Streptococcus gallolyticus subsp. gallolyticus]|uniref:ABC transporter substrate-binding protein n=1 Tax=Streptococcus gallolyticus TaxID=315405 RepID=UPI0005C55984|nr:sugar ABC transporter substrate-binding protein [Streptococcus gallolyticus]MCY7157683.1 sugar ABC transporter substrate-binding protein [Streptococcus gallolyticus subsp. gallolyticus]
MTMTKLTKIKLWLSVLVLLSACVGGYVYYQMQQKTILKIGVYAGSSWDVPNGNDYKVIDTAIKRFEKLHPSVKVVYESGISKADYSNWLTDQIVAGKQPDVFIVPEDDFNLLSSTGALSNLDSSISTSFYDSIFYKSSYQAGEYNHSHYALPFESNPTMMCINIDLLEKEGISIPKSGWTVDDFYNICKQVTKDTDGDGVIDQYGCVGYTWQQAVAAYGAKLFNETGSKAYFDSEKVKKALGLITQLKALNGNYEVTTKDFDEGKVAFIPMSLAMYRTYKPYPYHVAKYSTFSWSCVTMPASQKGGDATQVSTSLYAISSKTKHRSAAWKFLKFLCTDEKVQQSVFNYSQGSSVLKSVMRSQATEDKLKEDGFGSESLTVSTLDSMLSQGVTKPTFKTYNSVMNQADYIINKSLANNSIDSDLFAIQKEIEDSLK